jgi:hypothetical protein
MTRLFPSILKITASTASLVFLSACAMTQGDATLGSQGHGLQLGGHAGFQVGGTSSTGGPGR